MNTGKRWTNRLLVRVPEAAILPKWYGVAWWDPCGPVAVCAPMPLHVVLGFVRAIFHEFRQGYRPESYRDEFGVYWPSALDAGMARAYQYGYKKGAERKEAFWKAESDRREAAALARGESKGRLDVVNELIAMTGVSTKQAFDLDLSRRLN